jgi:hypothetical protein
MDLYVLFGMRLESYGGEYAPEVLVCWEGASVDENAEGFEAACDEARKKHGAEMVVTRVIKIAVDGEKIYRLLTSTPTVTGTVSET